MTPSDRIEAAARAMWTMNSLASEMGLTWDASPFSEHYREVAAAAVAAAYPELNGDSPSHWLAPNEATEEMEAAAEALDDRTGFYDRNASGEEHYRAMRDAYRDEGVTGFDP